VGQKLREYVSLYSEYQSKNAVATKVARDMLARLDAAVSDAKASDARARECLATVKKPEEPTLDEGPVLSAIAKCDVRFLERRLPELLASKHPKAANLLNRVTTKIAECKKRESREACRKLRGDKYFVRQGTCGCMTGYEISGGGKCKEKTTTLTRSEANKECERVNNSRFYQAGKKQPDGSWTCERTEAGRREYCRTTAGAGYYPSAVDRNNEFRCIPTQKTANRWCNSNNSGSGWYAVKIKADGSFNCTKSRKQQRSEARADCRRQARNAGKVYAFTKINKDGTYRCHWCEPGFRYRKGQCYPRNARRQQQQQRDNSGRYKPQYRCTYYNPDGSILGGAGSYSTVITQHRVRGANCTRIR
jgi:hypothetical protein